MDLQPVYEERRNGSCGSLGDSLWRSRRKGPENTNSSAWRQEVEWIIIVLSCKPCYATALFLTFTISETFTEATGSRKPAGKHSRQSEDHHTRPDCSDTSLHVPLFSALLVLSRAGMPLFCRVFVRSPQSPGIPRIRRLFFWRMPSLCRRLLGPHAVYLATEGGIFQSVPPPPPGESSSPPSSCFIDTGGSGSL